MFQFQTYYRDKCRQFYVQTECDDYSQIVEHIVLNINTLFGMIFQIQYCNDENEWITLSENADDVRDMFRCSRIVESADFKRIKIKIVEGCSPAVSHPARTVSESPVKHPKRLKFDSARMAQDDTYATIEAYRSPIELDISRKKTEISSMEDQISFYETEYEKLST